MVASHNVSAQILTLAFSSGDEYIVSGSADRTVRTWSQGGDECLILQGHTSSVYCVKVVLHLDCCLPSCSLSL